MVRRITGMPWLDNQEDDWRTPGINPGEPTPGTDDFTFGVPEDQEFMMGTDLGAVSGEGTGLDLGTDARVGDDAFTMPLGGDFGGGPEPEQDFNMENYVNNLLGRYRGQDVQHYDPQRRQRIEQLGQFRNQQLGRQEDIAGGTRDRSLEALTAAYGAMNPGAVQKGVDPRMAASPYIQTARQYGSTMRGVSDKRITGREDDVNRLNQYVDEAQDYVMGEEQKDYDRSLTRERLDLAKQKAGAGQAVGLYTTEDGRKVPVFAVPDPKTGTQKYVYRSGGRVETVKDMSNVEAMPGRLGGVGGASGRTGTVKEESYIDPNSGKRFYRQRNNVTNETVWTTAQGEVLENNEVPSGLVRDVGVNREQQELGKTRAEQQESLFQAEQAAYKLKGNLNNLESVLEGVSTGPVTGNPAFETVAGVYQQLTGSDPGDIESRQQAQSIIRRLVLAERAKMQGQGTITDQEQRMIEQSLPNLGISDEANKRIINTLRRSANRQIQMAQDWLQYRERNPGANYNVWRSRYLAQKNKQWQQETPLEDKIEDTSATGDSNLGQNPVPTNEPQQKQQQQDQKPSGVPSDARKGFYQGKPYWLWKNSEGKTVGVPR